MASFTACPPSPRRRIKRAVGVHGGDSRGSIKGSQSKNRMYRTFSDMDDPFALSASSESDERSSSAEEDDTTFKDFSAYAEDSLSGDAVSSVKITCETTSKSASSSGSNSFTPKPLSNTKSSRHTRSFRDFAPKVLPLANSQALPSTDAGVTEIVDEAVRRRTLGTAFHRVFDGKEDEDLKNRSYPKISEKMLAACNKLLGHLTKPVGYYDSGFEEDFASISIYSQEAGAAFADQTLQTRIRNRYANVLPLRDTIVTLRPVSKSAWENLGYTASDKIQKKDPQRSRGLTIDETSTYINANYVMIDLVDRTEGISCEHDEQHGISYKFRPHGYIAAQAPKSDFLDEFWIMIWDESVPVITMVTRCTEGKKVKASPYWPVQYHMGDRSVESENPEHTIGDVLRCGPFQLTLLSCVHDSGIITRKIQMVNLSGNDATISEPRVITHLQFLEWPDFDVPAHVSSLDPLLEAMDAHRRESALSGPTVVHCSAGIGRTGTILAIDMTIKKLKAAMQCKLQDTREMSWASLLGCKYHPLDIHSLVLHIRSQRHGCVINFVSYVDEWLKIFAYAFRCHIFIMSHALTFS